MTLGPRSWLVGSRSPFFGFVQGRVGLGKRLWSLRLFVVHAVPFLMLR